MSMKLIVKGVGVMLALAGCSAPQGSLNGGAAALNGGAVATSATFADAVTPGQSVLAEAPASSAIVSPGTALAAAVVAPGAAQAMPAEVGSVYEVLANGCGWAIEGSGKAKNVSDVAGAPAKADYAFVKVHVNGAGTATGQVVLTSFSPDTPFICDVNQLTVSRFTSGREKVTRADLSGAMGRDHTFKLQLTSAYTGHPARLYLISYNRIGQAAFHYDMTVDTKVQGHGSFNIMEIPCP